ncbi:Sodium Bile acid symporter family protein [Natribacillus halophilus]|uniref:Sodium Bile acid symporter family protein n=1 Tax=Natribacillus halophilus TaxID=549003 RepID=A0A1G8LNL9_9BACI|nr:Sodium Bile acid symporter family protein [Natribacillus halophilus]
MEAVSPSTIIESIVMVLVIPFAMAHLTRYLLKNKQTFLNDKLIPFFSSAQIIFLALAITAMFASEGSYLINNLEIIYILMIPVLLFFVINFVVAQTVGKALKFSYEDTVSLNLTVIARNSPVAVMMVIMRHYGSPSYL